MNVESAQAFRENIKEALTAILSEIASRARSFLNTNYLEDIWYDIISRRSGNALNELLTQWTEMDHQPKVLIIDEIDSLIGDTLISVLRQLRS